MPPPEKLYIYEIEGRVEPPPELAARYNLYPAASIFGSTVPGVSSGQGLSPAKIIGGVKLASPI